MATEPLNCYDTPGEDVYFVVINSDDEFFDFDDATFKVLGSAVEPELAATEDTDAGGIGESGYSADLNLALINAGPVVGVYTVQAMQQLGGSPDPDSDMMLGPTELRIANGMLMPLADAGELAPGYAVKCGMNVTNEMGSAVQCYAWVEYQGQPVTLGVDDTCVFDIFEYGSGLSQIAGPTDEISPSANGDFVTEVDGPNFTSGTSYKITAVIVYQGVTIYGQERLPMVG